MIKIVENRKIFFTISLCVLLLAIAIGIYNSASGNGLFNYDVDFSGGTSMQYDLGDMNTQAADVQQIIAEASGVTTPRVQKVVGTSQVTVLTTQISVEQRDAITEALTAKYPNTKILAFSEISSTVSDEMKQKAVTAILIACIAMLIYISIRFHDVKMGASAIAALIHDVVVLLAVYIIFRVPVNNSFIAAILTILGYSINATIVVFDRIRENRKFVKRHELELLINRSINQTLARSINTSVTTLLTIVCVYIFGVKSVREFAFPLIIGIISGAYSSVFFAGSVWYTLCKKGKKKPAAENTSVV